MAYDKMYDKNKLKNEVERLERQAKINWKKELRTLEYLGLKDGQKILEVGSGSGAVTDLLLNSLDNISITSLDIDREMMKVAKARFSDVPPGKLEFLEESITDTLIEDNTYDLVIARMVFQHLDNVYRAAEEIYRVLKPGGRVIIVDIDNGIWGVTYPYNNLIDMINSGVSQFQNKTGGDREIGRRLLKVLKDVGFEDLDFEVLASHSDILGKGYFKGRHKMSNTFNKRKNLVEQQMYNMMRKYEKFFEREDTSIILFTLFAAGSKSDSL